MRESSVRELERAWELKEIEDQGIASVRTLQGWIRDGSLSAVLLSRSTSSRKPRFKVLDSVLRDFLRQRSTGPVERPSRRRKRAADSEVLDIIK
jgi:hypothetical protein